MRFKYIPYLALGVAGVCFYFLGEALCNILWELSEKDVLSVPVRYIGVAIDRLLLFPAGLISDADAHIGICPPFLIHAGISFFYWIAVGRIFFWLRKKAICSGRRSG